MIRTTPEDLLRRVHQLVNARNEEHRWVLWPGGAR